MPALSATGIDIAPCWAMSVMAAYDLCRFKAKNKDFRW